MEDQVCPQCRTTKYRNPSLKLLVNVCGHSLCENCVELLFLKGTGACPECGIVLKRNSFRTQVFEDLTVEKEVDIRKRILRDYNKKEEDFDSLEEYNDYLEDVESIIYNLVNGIDIMETNKKIDQYKRDHKDQIIRNKLKIGRTEMELEELIELEQEHFQSRKAELVKGEVESKMKKIIAKEALIDELMFSDTSAKSIVQTFKDRSLEETEADEEKELPQRQSHFSTGIKMGLNRNFDFVPVKVEEASLYMYTEPVINFNGPDPPTSEPTSLEKYLPFVKPESVEEKAGGYNQAVCIKRIVQDAVSGLYFSFKSA